MEVLIPPDAIARRVRELADEVARDYHGRAVTIVGVLTGCLIFLADLVRQLDLPLRIHLVQASSYRGAATAPGPLQLRLDTLPELAGRHVLIVDDILDTGRTLSKVVEELTRRGAESVRVAVLLHCFTSRAGSRSRWSRTTSASPSPTRSWSATGWTTTTSTATCRTSRSCRRRA
jgi:hypoxanthine phosphoribosyltransferase